MVQKNTYHKTRDHGVAPEDSAVENVAEAAYWHCFRRPQVFSQRGPCVAVAIAPESGDVFVAASIRVTQRSASGFDHERTVCKLRDNIQGMALRTDGRLVAVGTVEGDIMVVDPVNKATLRTLSGHRAAVKSMAFLPDKVHLISASDDKTVSLWDIATGSLVWTAKVFSDFVRSCAVSSSRDGLFAAGSYDHSVRLWRAESQTPVMTFSHGSPVEAVAFFPDASCIATAGLSSVRIWDISGDDAVVRREIAVHHKTISSIHITSDGRYLITASLDQSVKIVRLSDFTIAHQFKLASAIMSLSVSHDYRRVALGLTNGQSAILSFAPIGRDVIDDRTPSRDNSQRKEDIVSFEANDSSLFVISRGRTEHLHRFDKFLRAFRYREAIDEVIRVNRPASFAIAVFELLRRHGLVAALSGRSESELLPLVDLLMKCLGRPQLMSMAIEAAFTVVEIYGPVAHKFPTLENKLRALDSFVRYELAVEEQMCQLSGQLAMITEEANLK